MTIILYIIDIIYYYLSFFNHCNLQIPDERDEELIVAGWGLTDNKRDNRGRAFVKTVDLRRRREPASILQKLVVPYVPIAECRETRNYKAFKKISSTRHLCAGGERGILNISHSLFSQFVRPFEL